MLFIKRYLTVFKAASTYYIDIIHHTFGNKLIPWLFKVKLICCPSVWGDALGVRCLRQLVNGLSATIRTMKTAEIDITAYTVGSTEWKYQQWRLMLRNIFQWFSINITFYLWLSSATPQKYSHEHQPSLSALSSLAPQPMHPVDVLKVLSFQRLHIQQLFPLHDKSSDTPCWEISAVAVRQFLCHLQNVQTIIYFLLLDCFRKLQLSTSRIVHFIFIVHVSISTCLSQQWCSRIERPHHMRKVRCSNPNRHRPKS